MRVVIDEQLTDVQAETVGEALAEAVDRAEQHGRLIVDVTVDGESWTDQRLTSPEGSATKADEVRLQSADPSELVAGTFANAAEALLQADAIQKDAAAKIQSGQSTEGMQQLNEAIAIWASVGQAVDHGSQLIAMNLDEMTIDDIPLTESIESLNGQLRHLRDALSDRDMVGVSDTLLYEMPDTVQHWRSILTDLQQRVQEAGAS